MPRWAFRFRGVDRQPRSESSRVKVAARAKTCLLVLCPTAALLSERFGRKPFLVIPALGAEILAVPIFLLLQGSYATVLLAHALVGSLIGLFGGAYPAAFTELFPTKVRYSALARLQRLRWSTPASQACQHASDLRSSLSACQTIPLEPHYPATPGETFQYGNESPGR